MSLKKVMLGYHTKDGGKIFKEYNTTGLLSNIYCEFCQSSSIKGNLNVNVEIATDITTASAEVGGGDLPGTDDEYKGALAAICHSFNTAWGGFMRTISTSRPFFASHELARITNTVQQAQSSMLLDKELLLKQVADTANEVVTYTDGTGPSIDGTVVIGSYFFSQGNISLLDTITNASVITAGSGNKYIVPTDTASNSVITSTSFTTTDNFNEVSLMLVGAGDIDGTQYQDWTRGTTLKVEVSSDGGVSWVKSGYIPLEGVSYPYVYRTATLSITPGNEFAWKLTFIGDAEVSKQAFYSLLANLIYRQANDANSILYDRYTTD